MSPTDVEKDQSDREIDLRDLAIILIEGWRWILGAILIAVILGGVYKLAQKPVLQTQFQAVPATEGNFSSFNILGGFSVDPEDVYQTLAIQLSSAQNFKAFVENGSADVPFKEGDDVEAVFNKRFSFDGVAVQRARDMNLVVQYKFPEGEGGEELLQSYLDFSAKRALTSLGEQFANETQSEIDSLETKLRLERSKLEKVREDRLFELNQAIKVARKLGLEKPSVQVWVGQSAASAGAEQSGSSFGMYPPLYFLGYRALEANRDVIKDDISAGLNSAQTREIEQQVAERREVLELISSGKMLNSASASDHKAVSNLVDVVESPSSGRTLGMGVIKTLVVCAFLGGVLGVILVFGVRFGKGVLRYRQQSDAD
ncbi:Wzz/FepE/Etk N-terminal domain-containing protein [Marinobacter mangrovi]|uniref:Wzz/FepE/Etk N-terminal domain-containing protein n=1 Tax=Marinobacter mangrovi TaxID=2803918 RepID=UPI0019314802|nr:Wzz/FepE/Etk N-terminal domain-containing protein [Marinobacter mangrovi]